MIDQFDTVTFKGKDIRCLKLNNHPYFVGNDAAKAIGYAKPEKAVLTHVEKEDKCVVKIQTPNGQKWITLVSPIGLYGLACRSKLPQADLFGKTLRKKFLPLVQKSECNYTGEQIVSRSW